MSDERSHLVLQEGQLQRQEFELRSPSNLSRGERNQPRRAELAIPDAGEGQGEVNTVHLAEDLTRVNLGEQMLREWHLGDAVFIPHRSDRKVVFRDQQRLPLNTSVGTGVGGYEVNLEDLPRSQEDLPAVRPLPVRDYGRIKPQKQRRDTAASRHSQGKWESNPHYLGERTLRHMGIAGRHMGVASKSL